MRNIEQAALCILLAGAIAACTGGSARVGDVWTAKRLNRVAVTDQDLFLTDRASRLRVVSSPLPSSEQGQDFLVTWRGDMVRSVMFEYRQINVPDKVMSQTVRALDRHSNVFAIRGDDFHNTGAVTAWRVSLWSGDQLLSDKKSALW